MKFKTLSVLLLACSFLTVANAQSVTLYESTGKYGEKRFSQIQPTDTTKFQSREFRSDGRISDAGKMSTLPDQATPAAPSNDAQKMMDEAKKMIDEQNAKILAERCQNMRTNLAAMSTGGRIYENNPTTGERVYLNDQEISSKRQRTQAAIDKECK